jgi:hypothetical protein
MRYIGDSVLSLRSNNQDFVYESYYIYIYYFLGGGGWNCSSKAPCAQMLTFVRVYISLTTIFDITTDEVKCTLVQALRFCTGRTAYRGSRGIALPGLNHDTRRGKVSASLPGRTSPPGKTRYPLYRRLDGRKAGLDGCGKSSTIGIRFPDRPASSQSLYRLSYSGPFDFNK